MGDIGPRSEEGADCTTRSSYGDHTVATVVAGAHDHAPRTPGAGGTDLGAVVIDVRTITPGGTRGRVLGEAEWVVESPTSMSLQW